MAVVMRTKGQEVDQRQATPTKGTVPALSFCRRAGASAHVLSVLLRTEEVSLDRVHPHAAPHPASPFPFFSGAWVPLHPAKGLRGDRAWRQVRESRVRVRLLSPSVSRVRTPEEVDISNFLRRISISVTVGPDIRPVSVCHTHAHTTVYTGQMSLVSSSGKGGAILI